MTLKELTERAERLNAILSGGSLMQTAISDLGSVITSLNKQNQLYDKGINADGVSIWSYRPYSQYTIREKQRKGQPHNRVTLKDTGDFYGSFNVMADKSQFEVFATDPKTAYLRAKYGNIFGLTQENKQILIEDYLRDKIATLVKSIIYG